MWACSGLLRSVVTTGHINKAVGIRSCFYEVLVWCYCSLNAPAVLTRFTGSIF